MSEKDAQKPVKFTHTEGLAIKKLQHFDDIIVAMGESWHHDLTQLDTSTCFNMIHAAIQRRHLAGDAGSVDNL